LNALKCTSEVVFKVGDMSYFNHASMDANHASMDAFELEYDFVHVRVFTDILS